MTYENRNDETEQAPVGWGDRAGLNSLIAAYASISKGMNSEILSAY